MAGAVSVEIRASASPGEVRVAVVDGDSLRDYAIWRPGSPDGVGDIHSGRVLRHVPAMAGAFVQLDGVEGFLPDSEGGRGLTEGTRLVVRVTRSPQGGKGPRLSARVEDPPQPGERLGLLRRGLDPVRRLALRYPDAPVLVDDAGLAATLKSALDGRVRVVPEVFDDALLGTLEELAGAEVDLPGGARASIHPTPALVAIDVDAAAALARSGGHERLNRAVIPALAAQIRLRNLSGAIVVDLAGMPIRRRAALGPVFEQALTADSMQPRFLGFSALGLAEILRPRLHPPLHELLAGPHAAGLAGLRAVAAQITTRPGWAPVMAASADVVADLQADPVALDDLRRRAGRPVTLRSQPGWPACSWRVEGLDG